MRFEFKVSLYGILMAWSRASRNNKMCYMQGLWKFRIYSTNLVPLQVCIWFPFLVTLHNCSFVYKDEMDFDNYNDAIEKHRMGLQEKNRV